MNTIIEKFKTLRLKNCANNIETIIEQANQKNLSPLQTIERLIDIEIEHRDKARKILRFKQSKLDTKVTIDQFDFKYHKSRQNQKSMILRSKIMLRWAKRYNNWILRQRVSYLEVGLWS
ncbi:MAG: hypothetical protein HOJ48_20435 [Desulfobacula sp.]|nr:hypothetical protein [Desulfobacula sp.]